MIKHSDKNYILILEYSYKFLKKLYSKYSIEYGMELHRKIFTALNLRLKQVYNNLFCF